MIHRLHPVHNPAKKQPTLGVHRRPENNQKDPKPSITIANIANLKLCNGIDHLGGERKIVGNSRNFREHSRGRAATGVERCTTMEEETHPSCRRQRQSRVLSFSMEPKRPYYRHYGTFDFETSALPTNGQLRDESAFSGSNHDNRAEARRGRSALRAAKQTQRVWAG